MSFSMRLFGSVLENYLSFVAENNWALVPLLSHLNIQQMKLPCLQRKKTDPYTHLQVPAVLKSR